MRTLTHSKALNARQIALRRANTLEHFAKWLRLMRRLHPNLKDWDAALSAIKLYENIDPLA